MIVRSCWFESSTGHSGPGNAVAGAFFLENSGVYLNHFGFSTWMIAKSKIGKVPSQNAYHPWVHGTCGENT